MSRKILKLLIATLFCIILLNNVCFAKFYEEISFIPSYFYTIIICTIIIIGVILIANYEIKKEKISAIIIKENEENKEELDNIEKRIKKLSKIKFIFYLILLFIYFIVSFINVFIFNKVLFVIYIIITIFILYCFYKKEYKKTINIFRIAIIIATIISLYYNIKVISFNNKITNKVIYKENYEENFIVQDDQLTSLIIRIKANNIEKNGNKITFEYMNKGYYTDYELEELQKNIDDFKAKKFNKVVKSTNSGLTKGQLVMSNNLYSDWNIKIEKNNKGYIEKIIILDKEKEL